MKDRILLKALKECDIDINPLDIDWLDKNSIIIAEKIKYQQELSEEELKLLESVDYLTKDALEKYLLKTAKEQNAVTKDELMNIKNTLSRKILYKEVLFSHGKS
jgi:hypothetical protein